MTSNKQILEKAMLDITAKNIVEEERMSFKDLQKSAQKFLNDIKIMDKRYKNLITKARLSEAIQGIYMDMRLSSSYTQEVLQSQHIFEMALNDFLGRKIYLSYVYTDGGISFLGDGNISELYQKATANVGRGNIGESVLESFTEQNDVIEKIKKELQESIKKRKAVYQTAYQRYEKTKKEKMHYKNSAKTYYWYINEEKNRLRHTNPINTAGIIAEAYANAVINQDEEILGSPEMVKEHSLEVLWTNYINGKKDSIPAIVKGDVVYKNDGNIQFAVKAGSFSTAKIRQYITFAYNILRLEDVTAEQLANSQVLYKMTQIGKNADRLIEAFKNHTEKELIEQWQLKARQK